MDWLEGKPLLSFKLPAQEDAQRLALRMFRAWYVPFYNYAVIHGDPHLGNYTVRDDLDLNLLDFGCIRVFRPEFVKGVIDLYWALERGDRDLAVDAYRNWGFDQARPCHHRRPQRVGGLPLRPADGGPAAADRGDQQQPLGPPGGRAGAPEAARGRRRHAAARVRVHGPGRDRPRRRVHAPRREVNWHRLFMELIADFDLETTARTPDRGAAAPGAAAADLMAHCLVAGGLWASRRRSAAAGAGPAWHGYRLPKRTRWSISDAVRAPCSRPCGRGSQRRG